MLEVARGEALGLLGQRLDGLAQGAHQLLLLLHPQRGGPEAIFGWGGGEDLPGDGFHTRQALVQIGRLLGLGIGVFEDLMQHRAEHAHIVAFFWRGARLQAEGIGNVEIKRAGTIGFELAGAPAEVCSVTAGQLGGQAGQLALLGRGRAVGQARLQNCTAASNRRGKASIFIQRRRRTAARRPQLYSRGSLLRRDGIFRTHPLDGRLA